jgi:ATP-binding cassette subfamily F protein uup
MERFWFTGDLQFAPVGTLSGGERRRLQMLLVLAGRPNVLLLDEPTNDLDLDTLRILEDFFEDWPGALVVVSHDRTFLERTTDRLVAVDEHGGLAAVAGGVAAWVSLGGAVRAPATPQGPVSPGPVSPGPVSPGLVLPAAVPLVRPSPASSSAPSSAPSSARSSARSASTLGRLLRDTEKDLARLQRRRDQLSASLSGLADWTEVDRIGAELTEAQAALDEIEERWLALAEEAEGPR